jgi:arginase
MKPLHIIYVPYDSGRAGERFGRGPLKARDSGLASRLSASITVKERIVLAGGFFPTEATIAFDLARRISHLVADARSEGAFPIVIAGNCISSLGTVSGMGGARRAVVWLDAHADFNTPDTTKTAFLDGMGSAILTGEAWRAASQTVPHFQPVDRDHLLFIGVRDIDAEEAERLRDPPVTLFSGDDYRANEAGVVSALQKIGNMSDTAYLHFDMDVTEPSPVPANEYASKGGFSDGQVTFLLKAIADRVPLAAAGVTAYDPGLDADGSMLIRYLNVIEQLAMLGAQL